MALNASLARVTSGFDEEKVVKEERNLRLAGAFVLGTPAHANKKTDLHYSRTSFLCLFKYRLTFCSGLFVSTRGLHYNHN